MKVFISGASGLIGGNCLTHFKEKKWDLIGSHLSYPTDATVYYNTLDQSHADNFDIKQFQPDVIVHCGALTHVDYCEEHIDESYQKTVQSTINLTNIAKEINAKLVLLSTDYVFDGTSGPYTEDAKVNPLSVYGKHKLEAEQFVQNNLKDYLILRVTNVYGNELRNKNFVARIVEQCKKGEKLTLKLPIDQYASPTNAFDIARAMAVLLEENKAGIYHIGSTDYMNRVALALNVMKSYPNATYELTAITTGELRQIAPRPLLGGFITKKFNEEFPEFIFNTVKNFLD